jgi:hypothetical protein
MHHAGNLLEQVNKVRSSFLKKRSKRLLFLVMYQLSGHDPDVAAGGKIKVFWFFFSKKNCFLPC